MILGPVVGVVSSLLALGVVATRLGVQVGGSDDEAATALQGPFPSRALAVLIATTLGLGLATLIAGPAFRGAAIGFAALWAALWTDETMDVAAARTAYVAGTIALVVGLLLISRFGIPIRWRRNRAAPG